MNNTLRYKYHSLEDFLMTMPLNVDGVSDDGWGAFFSVKGREIEATILFTDISGFSRRTLNLNPTETLIFVNNFFCWITAEALMDRPGIVDKYIGDEMMVLFSDEFGSEDHFSDAIQTARWMSENDMLAFCPHMGIASGKVTVGYVGTPLKYNCSVFGNPVAIAARCASIKPTNNASSSIIFPADLWKEYEFEKIFPPVKKNRSNGKIVKEPPTWKVLPSRVEKIKNMPDLEVIEVAHMIKNIPSQSAEQRAKEIFENLKKYGFYRQFKKL